MIAIKLNENGYIKIYEDGTIVSVVGAYENDKEVKEYIENGGVVKEQFTQQELFLQTIKSYELLIDNIIQSKINDYNITYKTSFRNIDALPKFLFDDTYTHYAFCAYMIGYVKNVWEYVRAEFEKVEQGLRELPSKDELIAELPSYNFIG